MFPSAELITDHEFLPDWIEEEICEICGEWREDHGEVDPQKEARET